MSTDSASTSAAPLNRPMITISIMLATLIQTLDSTIANVALPHMQGTLSASQDEITWVLTSYIGAFALFGVATFLPAREPKHDAKFDAFGFATLGLAIGALQAMLDRGEQLDWFGSNEIVIEALVAAISFAFFLVHTATVGKKSFFKYELLKDPNFATGTFFIFVIGAVMYATRALLPPMLQNLMNYPVATTGLVTAPSGAGTMVAMLFAGRLLKRVGAPLLLLPGSLIPAFTLLPL